MLGGKQKRPLGYTIIEVMIVLAVSGVMFVIAANFINGKQAKTAFTSGVNEMASKIQDTIEQVTDGRYSDISLDCTSTGTTINPVLGVQPQGHNPQCVFLGKVVQFRANNIYRTLPIAGSRLDASGNPSTDYSSAKAIHDLLSDQTVPQNLTVSQIKINNSAITTFGIGFLQSLGSLDNTGNLSSGGQTVGLYYVAGMTQSDDDAVITGTSLNSANSAAICVTDGVRNAEIQLGGTDTNASSLSVRVKMLGATACS